MRRFCGTAFAVFSGLVPTSNSAGEQADSGFWILGFVACLLSGFACFMYAAISRERQKSRQQLLALIENRRARLDAAQTDLNVAEANLSFGCRPGEKSPFAGRTEHAQMEIAAAVADMRVAIAALRTPVDHARVLANQWWGLDRARRALDGRLRVGHEHGQSRRYRPGCSYWISDLVGGLDGIADIAQAYCRLQLEQSRVKLGPEAIARLKQVQKGYAQNDSMFVQLGKAASDLIGQFEALAVRLVDDPIQLGVEYGLLEPAVLGLIDKFEAGLRYHRRREAVQVLLSDRQFAMDTRKGAPVALMYPGEVFKAVNTVPRAVPASFDHDDPQQHLDSAATSMQAAAAAAELEDTHRAEQLVADAEKSIGSFEAHLDEIDRARLLVEDQVPNLEHLVHQLRVELIALEREVLNTSYNFLPEDVGVAAARLNAASVAESWRQAHSLLEGCAADYVEQRFREAAAKLQQVRSRHVDGMQQLKDARSEVANLIALGHRARATLSNWRTIHAVLAKPLPAATSQATHASRAATTLALSMLVAAQSADVVDWRAMAAMAVEVDAGLVELGRSLAADEVSYRNAMERIERAKRNGCPEARLQEALRAAGGGNFGAAEALVVAYVVAPSSSGTGSSCSSGATSSCASSCGGGGCGGGGCGGTC